MLSNRWAILAALFTARISMGFQFQSIASVTPFLVDDLGFTFVQIGTLIGVFMLPGVFIALPGGYLGDRFGDKRMCWTGLALMAVGGLVIAVSESYTLAIAGRLISGVGAVLLNVMVTKMVTGGFAGKEIITAIGVILGSWPFGIAVALVVQSAVADAYSWQAVMYLTAIACAVSFGMVVSLYRNHPDLLETASKIRGRFTIPWREFLPVSMAGLAWGSFNIGMVLFFSFAPGLLTDQGMSKIDAGAVVSVSLWINIVSVPLGAYLVERLGRPMAAIAVLSVTGSLGLFLLPYAPFPVIMSVLVGLGVGAAGPIVALPSRSLSPENLGPFMAGRSRDITESPTTPILLGGGAFVATVVFVALYQVFQAKNPVDVVSARP